MSNTENQRFWSRYYMDGTVHLKENVHFRKEVLFDHIKTLTLSIGDMIEDTEHDLNHVKLWTLTETLGALKHTEQIMRYKLVEGMYKEVNKSTQP